MLIDYSRITHEITGRLAAMEQAWHPEVISAEVLAELLKLLEDGKLTGEQTWTTLLQRADAVSPQARRPRPSLDTFSSTPRPRPHPRISYK